MSPTIIFVYLYCHVCDSKYIFLPLGYQIVIEKIIFVMSYRRKRKMVTVYLDTTDSILLLSKDKTFHVLYYILIQMDSERNIWYADKVHKRKIMDKLEISPVTLDKHISSLKNRKLILTTDARGRYRINTQLLST